MDRCVRFNRPVFQNILKDNASALHGQIDFMFCDMKQFKIVSTISYSAVEINFKLWIIKLEPAIAYVAKEIDNSFWIKHCIRLHSNANRIQNVVLNLLISNSRQRTFKRRCAIRAEIRIRCRWTITLTIRIGSEFRYPIRPTANGTSNQSTVIILCQIVGA